MLPVARIPEILAKTRIDETLDLEKQNLVQYPQNEGLGRDIMSVWF